MHTTHKNGDVYKIVSEWIQCYVKTAIPKGTWPFCPCWQVIFRRRLPDITYQSYLFQLVGCFFCVVFFSYCNQTTTGLEWNRAETTSFRWFQRSCVVSHQTAVVAFTCPNKLSQRGNAPLSGDNVSKVGLLHNFATQFHYVFFHSLRSSVLIYNIEKNKKNKLKQLNDKLCPNSGVVLYAIVTKCWLLT